jgi:cyclic pyranopterin phosphate synthase
MHDGFGRRIEYLRISVTDRCDLRCRYCMAEKMTFLPRKEVLSLEEIAILADRFIARGVRKIRLSGGEPLVRRDFMDLARRIGRHLDAGTLDELTLTTNGTRLAQSMPRRCSMRGMRRINVSLDSLDPDRFPPYHPRGRSCARPRRGLARHQRPGLRVKINMVALRGFNDDEIRADAALVRGART